MGPDLWELFEYGKEDDEVAAILRLAHHSALPKGVRVVTQFGEIVTVRLRRGDLLNVSGASEVVSMAAGDTYHGPDLETEMDAELSSDTVLPSDERRAKDSSANGKGVVVGVVDWGFDFAHPDFRREDGSSRIVALWDQRGGKQPNSPQPFNYGVIHDREAINKALRENDPYKALAYHPADADTGIGSHGTHVASIAAGSAGANRPGGVAPEADIILVHNAPWDELEAGKLGDSVTLLEAIDYISRTAGDRPWVINLSMGRHGEQHDGSTLIEQGLDAALRSSPGRAVCMSAGNYFNKRVHASGQLRPTQERTFVWLINERNPSDYNQLEIWYSWQDRFECSVRSPDGSLAATVKIGERSKLKVGGKEVGNVYHRAQEPNNLDNHITIYLYKEAPSGEWEVSILGSDVIDGRFHAWIEREVACPKCQSHFRAEDADGHTTTGTICNGRRTIAVGAYNAHDAELRIGPFSSVGPTRDGRLKPDLCAPGVSVLAARSAPREGPAGPLTRMSGTSMAAPHVTGTVALMFQAAPRRLRIEETHNLLLQNARHVSIPEDIPDRIGIGFLDVDEAVEAARNVGRGSPAFKEIVPTASAPKKAKAAAAGKESSGGDAVGTKSQEGFPAKKFIEAAVLQAALDGQPAQSEAGESETVTPRTTSTCGCVHAEDARSAHPERTMMNASESVRIPDERVRAGRGGLESESIPEGESVGIAAESVRHAKEKLESESVEMEAVGMVSQQTPRAATAVAEAAGEPWKTEVVATMELAAAEHAPESFVEIADQIVRQSSARFSAVELLDATLTKAACNLWTGNGERFPSAAQLFDAFAYWRSGGPREQFDRCFEVVGAPGSVLQEELRRSDLLVRRGDGDMGHIAIIASPQLKSLETVLTDGLMPETFSPGLYVQVVETGMWPHELADRFARLITEPNGRVPHRQMILRYRASSPVPQRRPGISAGNGNGHGPHTEHIIRAAAGMDSAGISRLIDDLLLLRLAAPPPPTVVTVAQPVPAATAQAPATTGADASEATFAEVDTRKSQAYIRWIQTSLDQIDAAGLVVDGVQGPLTTAAIRSFQTRHALDIDGDVGPQTEAELIAAGAERPPGYSLCAVASLGIVDPTSRSISAVGEKDYDAGTFTASTGRVLHIRGNVVYPAATSGPGTPFNPNLGAPAPIIFMAHGNHGIFFNPADRTKESCGGPGLLPIPNHKGYLYLQELLAAMGIISVSVDCNETNCHKDLIANNINERADLIVASIRHFQSLNSGSDPIFGGRINFSKVCLFGHSRGGEAVVVVPELTGARAAAGATIVGVLSLAPTDNGTSSGAPQGYAFMTILPAADGDVVENDGAKFYDKATPSPFKTQIYVHEANHNFFNREWVNPDAHSGAGPLTRPEHERLLSVYGSAFFREVFFTHGFRNLLLGKEIPPCARTGKVHVSAEVNNPAATIDDFENNNVTLNKLGQTVTLTGFSTANDFPFSQAPTAFNTSFFGNTTGLVLLRSSATNRLRSPLSAPTNLTGKEVWIRVAEVYSGTIPRGRTGFRIGLEDSRGRIVFVDSNAGGTLPRPFDRKSDDLLNSGVDFTKTMLETFRFPAGCFPSGTLDITTIRAIHLQLNRNDGRALAFDQLQIV
jgi:subtilisin family serine protease